MGTNKNLIDIFTLPQSTEEEVNIKKEAYKKLMFKAARENNIELAFICKDNLIEVKIK